MKTVDFIIFIIQALALVLNAIAGLIEHEVFYIAVAIIFAIFITGDSIERTIERKFDSLESED